MTRHLLATALLAALSTVPAGAQDRGLSVLLVTAHPDDDATFAATVWRIVRERGGTADLAVVTDGAGGYRFATLAEPLYGLKLTDPEVAKTAIPAIRRREVQAGGAIVGIRNCHFIDQPDTGKFLDVDSVFTHLWDTDTVVKRLADIIRAGDYDLVFTMLPVPATHAHHKGSALLTLRAVASLPADRRPLVLASTVGEEPGGIDFEVLDGHPDSRILTDRGPWFFDRDTRLGLEDRLSYRIINQWLIAEHKSQGTMQMYISFGRYELNWLYAMNTPGAIGRADSLLEAAGLSRADR
jgi:LmbE family N-acetylglucosaminyl deacetylase